VFPQYRDEITPDGAFTAGDIPPAEAQQSSERFRNGQKSRTVLRWNFQCSCAVCRLVVWRCRSRGSCRRAQISHHHRAMLRMLIKRCLQNVASKLPFENGYSPGLQTFDSYCQGAFEKVPKSFAIMSRLQPSDAVKIINSNKKILGTY
jgi:hypothetical protein